jgi:Spy/CpxP family protein refolding chaperone
MNNRLIVTCVAALAASAVAFGQAAGAGSQGGPPQGGRGGPQGGMRMGMGMGGPQILNRPEVQKELALTDEQKTALQPILQSLRPTGPPQGGRGGGAAGGGGNAGGGTAGAGAGAGGRGGFQGGDMQQMQAAREKADAEIKKILSETQFKRYQELTLQLQGTNALNRPDIQTSLGFTDDQKAKLREIQQGQREAMQGAMEAARAAGDRQAVMQKMQELRTETEKKTLAVLTESQLAQWNAMLGKKFEFERIGRPPVR